MMIMIRRHVLTTLVVISAFGMLHEAAAQSVPPFVNVGGVRFAALDGTDPRALTGDCDNDPFGIALPSGWTLADNDDHTKLVIKMFRFGTGHIVLSDGSTWSAGRVQQHTNPGSNALVYAGLDRYAVDFCHKRVLIRSPGQPGDLDEIKLVPTISEFVTWRGRDYATIDNSEPLDLADTCQDGYYAMPAGWGMAPDNEDSRTALLAHKFATGCLVTQTGRAYRALSGEFCSQDELRRFSSPGFPDVHAVAFCNKKLLVSRVSAAASPPLEHAVVPAHIVYSHGREFATLDAAVANTGFPPALGCQAAPLRVPSGWTLATSATPGVQTVIHDNDWSTSCVVLGDGAGFSSRAFAVPCGTASQLVSVTDANADAFYHVDSCNKRVLITRDFSDDFHLPLRVLVLTPVDDQAAVPTLKLAATMLDAVGVAYDVYATADAAGGPKALPLPLTDDETGAPRYLGIIMTSAELSTAAGTSLSQAQRFQLAQYRVRYRVRLVSLHTYPTALAGMTPPIANYDTLAKALRFDAGVSADLASAVPLDVHYQRLPGNGRGYPTLIDAATSGGLVTPVMRWVDVDATTAPTSADPVAAAIRAVKEDGLTRTEELHFFFDQSVFHPEGASLAGMWLPWLTRGLYLGARRTMLHTQIDDVFLATRTFDEATGTTSTDPADEARVSTSDILATVAWQDSLRARLPHGSTYRMELAFNGMGAFLTNYPSSTMTTWYEQRDAFFWVSHTWSHPDLNGADYDTTAFEVSENERFANIYLMAPDGVDASAMYSNSSLVTPRISGLFNADALQAMLDQDVHVVIGDNSRPSLRAASPYHALATTVQDNGVAGLMIIPRSPTRVYFDTSTPDELVAENHHLFGPDGLFPFYDHKLSLEDIMTLEARLTSNQLLQLRHDPFMFHQANLVQFPYANTTASLFSLWADAVLDEYMQFSSLPVLSLKQDDLADAYVDRMRRDACGLDASVHVVAGVVSAVRLSSAGECVAAVTGVVASDADAAAADVSVETYGPDVTSWVPVTPGVERVLTLAEPVSFLIEQVCTSDAACDDASACTVDACDPFIGCSNVPIVCDDDNACTDDTCDPVLGCVFTPNDANNCGDNDVCNGADSCNAGVCVTSTAPVCDDDNACTDDACDPVLGCVFTPNNTNTCGDNDVCNGADSCNAGVCVTSAAPVCDDDNACTDDACDPVQGCVFTPNDANTCDDDDVCNGASTCSAGVCVAGTPLVCQDSRNCTVSACDALLGCTLAVDPAPECQAPVFNCTGVVCDDGNACTDDVCDERVGCLFNADNTNDCNDGDACNGAEMCQAGVCVPGAALICDDGNACTDDVCNATLGCVFAANDNNTCSDADACNGIETCASGVCVSGDALVCDDGNACTDDACDAAIGCVFSNDDSNVCSDGDACNGMETCSAGVCVNGTDITCLQDNPCAVMTCNAATGACDAVANTTGVCDDGNICNGAEVCEGTQCVLATPALVCDDGNACTRDTCDPAAGCAFTPDDTLSCDDGDVCNGAEQCTAGSCAAGVALACDDGYDCTANQCDALFGCQFGVCTDPFQGAGSCLGLDCDDGDACTLDTCDPVKGCFHAAITCDDGESCTSDSCDSATGCVHTPVPDATLCDDGDVCSIGDVCMAGVCTATPKDCVAELADDDNVCTDAVCNAVTGVCEHSATSDTDRSCDDGSACTSGDVCVAGACMPGIDDSAMRCDDGLACTLDSCDAAAGCINEPVDAAAMCSGTADAADDAGCSEYQCSEAHGCVAHEAAVCQCEKQRHLQQQGSCCMSMIGASATEAKHINVANPIIGQQCKGTNAAVLVNGVWVPLRTGLFYAEDSRLMMAPVTAAERVSGLLQSIDGRPLRLMVTCDGDAEPACLRFSVASVCTDRPVCTARSGNGAPTTCTVAWEDAASAHEVAALHVTSDTVLAGFRVTWTWDSDDAALLHAWGGARAMQRGRVAGLLGDAVLPADTPVNVGGFAWSDGSLPAPTSFAVNGVVCAVTNLPGGDGDGDDDRDGLGAGVASPGVAAGIAAGAIAGVAMIGVAGLTLLQFRRREFAGAGDDTVKKPEAVATPGDATV